MFAWLTPYPGIQSAIISFQTETVKWEFAIMEFVVVTKVRPQFLQKKRCFLHLKPYQMTA